MLQSRLMNRLLRLLLLASLLVLSGAGLAQQDPAPVRRAVESWLATQIKGLPGEVSHEIGQLDPGNQLIPCRRFDVNRPANASAWGRTNVQVRCLDEAGWRIYIPVTVRIKSEYVVSARQLSQGQILSADDLTLQFGDLSELPANIVMDTNLAVGKSLSISLPAGRPLRSEFLKAPLAIRQGQSVKIVSRGPGFAVANEGKAVNAAQEGQVVQVRLANGQTVSGIARQGGSVEVTF